MPPRKKQRKDTSARSSRPAATTNATSPETAGEVNAVSTTNQANESARSRGSSEPTTKATGKRMIRVKGRLQSLPDLAIELQLMIYSELESKDLHHLSRTCKKFRTFFLNRRLTERLWETARKNAGDLPERPPFMSEPAFIHLLYATNCHHCGAHNVRKIMHGHYLRLCSSCSPKRLVVYSLAILLVHDTSCSVKMHPRDAQEQIVSHFGFVKWSPSYCGVNADATFVMEEIPRLEDTPKKGRKVRSHWPEMSMVLKKDIEDIIERIDGLPQPIIVDDARALLRTIAQELKLRWQLAKAIRNWIYDRENRRTEQLEGARDRRFDAIITRLTNAGWGPELRFLGDDGLEKLAKKPIVRQSSELTEVSWLKVITSLDDFLQTTRSKRIASELRATLPARFEALEKALLAHYVKLPRNASMDCRPESIDLALIPECRALLDAPTGETVTTDDFAAIVPAMVEKWEANIKEQLTTYIRPHLGNIPPGTDPLSLVVAVFRCEEAPSPLRWPDILVHRCVGRPCTRQRYAKQEKFERDDVYTYTTKTLRNAADQEYQAARDPNYLRRHDVPFCVNALLPFEYARSAVNSMRAIVLAMGLDPTKATVEDLERCDVWLKCDVCSKKPGVMGSRVMSWRGAFGHRCYSFVRDFSNPIWCRADDNEMSQVRASRKWTLERYKSLDSSVSLSCALCCAFDSNPHRMQSHLKDKHGIKDAVQAMLDGTIYYHPSTTSFPSSDISIAIES
ncbi:hypothetical protein C2E23DRAFT_801914 [Lenzites betulinus]|nr:hypothetical protein C2E23DRAFT_801914 [Lenzites betulinus]